MDDPKTLPLSADEMDRATRRWPSAGRTFVPTVASAVPLLLDYQSAQDAGSVPEADTLNRERCQE
jgi:hypothetical protein